MGPVSGKIAGILCVLLAAGLLLRYAEGASFRDPGMNPHPVALQRPHDGPLSAVALLGQRIFHDPSLSASGKMSCASCHSPEHAYGPPDGEPVRHGGADGSLQGNRAVPSLRYLYRTPNFSIGPDVNEAENVDLNKLAVQSQGTVRAVKTAGSVAAPAMVPQGGLFWDGRANTFQTQAMGPLLNPAEMANRDTAEAAARLRKAPYVESFAQLFGPGVLKDPARLLDEAMFAVARYEVEDPSFHPYSSKYDYWLEGKAALTAEELRGLRLFDDKTKANCAGCHVDRPGRDGLPPLFTDFQYEALGVPRNADLSVDRDLRYYDLGLCGPQRADIRGQTQYCGMFRTPSLRNTSTRKVFFHNGAYHDLKDVLAFYAFRDVQPDKIYPKGPDGRVRKFDDVPAAYLGNVDVMDAPLDRKPGQLPAMSDADIRDIIAFLKTLDDGYRPEQLAAR